MYDPVTLDQLRALVAVVEEGSFSAAARRLSRVQSAVSTSMANLETQLGVTLWDRSTRIATLTEQGLAVVASARRVLAEVDGLRRLTAGLGAGLEARVSLCVDALFPVSALVDLCVDFAQEFPSVDLRVDTQTMSAVSQRVLDGRSTLGVVSPLGLAPGLVRQALTRVRMVPVVAPSHPLARVRGRIATPRLASSVQIVLSERHDDGVPDQGVLSSRTWRVADLHTKQALLRAGLGWGNLPEHVVRGDLQAGQLVAIRPAAWGPDEHALSLSVVHRADATFGPAHRWMLAHLETLCARDLGAPEPPPGRDRRRAGRRLSDKQAARLPSSFTGSRPDGTRRPSVLPAPLSRLLPAWLALTALLQGCSAVASRDVALAERLAAEGKTEEAAIALARVCPAAPASDACRAASSRLVSLRADAAARAASEARFLDAERHLLLALAAADRDAAAIEEKLAAPALREGIAWQRAVTLGPPEGRVAAMEVAARGTTPAAPVAKAWLAKELPAIRARDVLSACGPSHEGACTEAIAAFRALGSAARAGEAPVEADARALIETEDARRRALADEAEPLLAGFRELALLDRRYERCLALNADIPDPGTQVSHCHQTTYPRPSYAKRRELATAFRRLLARAGDPALVADLVARRAAAEATKLP